MKVLVIQTAFIGDAILGTAALESIHAAYPEAQLHYLVRKGNESLLKNHPFLTKTWIWDKSLPKFKALWALGKELRAEKFDIVVNLQRFASSGFLTWFSQAKLTIGFDKNPWSFAFKNKAKHSLDSGNHEIDRNFALIQLMDQEQKQKLQKQKPKLYPSQLDREKVKVFQHEPYVCLAPASVWFTKAWPVEHWIGLAKELNKTYKVYLCGGPGDKALLKEIQEKAQINSNSNLAGELSLMQSAALFEGARMNFVNDSGPLHLCTAVNASVRAIFCSTIPEFGFGPLSDDSKIVQLEPKPSCKPCGNHGKKECPLGHFKCGQDLSPAMVLQAI